MDMTTPATIQDKLSRAIQSYESVNKTWKHFKKCMRLVKAAGQDLNEPVMESVDFLLPSITRLRHKVINLKMLIDVEYLERHMLRHVRYERYEKAAEFRNRLEQAKKWQNQN